MYAIRSYYAYGLLSDYQINTHAPGTLGATDPTAFTDPTTRAALNELGDRGLYADDFTSRDEVLQELYHPGSIVNDEPPAPEYDPNAPDLAAEEFARVITSYSIHYTKLYESVSR